MKTAYDIILKPVITEAAIEDMQNKKYTFRVAKDANKIEIKAGYVRKESIFFGFVDDFTINYSANGAPSISVNGIDAKGYLMNAQDRKYMQEKSTTTVVKEILNECVSKGYAKKVKVGVIKDFDAELIQEEMDDYHFLCFLARTYNLTFTVIDGEIVFDSLMSKTSSII